MNMKIGIHPLNVPQNDIKARKLFAKVMKENGIKLVHVNLFEGSLEKADLTGADLSGSNMYGVEFLDAVTCGALMDTTNLKMTKLQKG